MRLERIRWLRYCVVLVWALMLAGQAARAQSNTRLLLSSGWGVPGRAGYVFGPITDLAMNEAKEIIFLTSLQGAKREMRAIIRSSGVTFSVVAFEGLRSPVPHASYESFSAPSMNAAGVIAFTATLKNDVPSAAVVRIEGGMAQAIAKTGGEVPGSPGATFQEFSPPVVGSRGNVLFGARTSGAQPQGGLFLWTLRGLQAVALPPELKLAPSDLLVPAFFSHDEAVFVFRGTPLAAAREQFFRAVAIKNFQDLKPPPELSDTVEVLAARPEETPVRMLLVLMEGDAVQSGVLGGEPAQPVLARRPPAPLSLPLSRIQGQATGPRGNIIFASSPTSEETDLALYCYCEGQVIRLTSPEDFFSIAQAAQGRPILSLAGDGQNTAAFVAANDLAGDAVAIYVTSLP